MRLYDAGLPSIYAVHNFDSYHAYNFKITRDAEIEIDEDDISISYLNKISEGLKKRQEGGHHPTCPRRGDAAQDAQSFYQKNQIHRLDTLSAEGRYHKLKDFLSFRLLPTWKLKRLTRPSGTPR